ncbi:MAG TPA: thiamine-phosphate kinase [Kiritimatiellia bacterium]|nr:thiamine-phosphate kinase [Kiritimatiellia bacterium]
MNTKRLFESEDDWTASLAGRLTSRDDVVVGIGDDAAVVRGTDSDDYVYTTDAVIESIHFQPGTSPRKIGRKLVGRLLSDLAAMGAKPGHILINLVVPAGTDADYLHELYDGANELAASFGAAIVGGDTVAAIPLALHGFAVGLVPRGDAVLRSGGQAGDVLFVTGTLGGSINGRHLDFIPRVREGLWLREGAWAHAMMDISDGLSRDLRRLCRAGGVGARIDASALPLSDEIASLPDCRNAVHHALCDGEDYELLFVVPRERVVELERNWPADFAKICRIGLLCGPADVIEISHDGRRWEPLPAAGFDHMR